MLGEVTRSTKVLIAAARCLFFSAVTVSRFPPLWSVAEQEACFVVRDHNGRTSRGNDLNAVLILLRLQLRPPEQ